MDSELLMFMELRDCKVHVVFFAMCVIVLIVGKLVIVIPRLKRENKNNSRAARKTRGFLCFRVRENNCKL